MADVLAIMFRLNSRTCEKKFQKYMKLYSYLHKVPRRILVNCSHYCSLGDMHSTSYKFSLLLYHDKREKYNV